MKTKTSNVVCTNVMLSKEEERKENFTIKFAQAINFAEKNKRICDRNGRVYSVSV